MSREGQRRQPERSLPPSLLDTESSSAPGGRAGAALLGVRQVSEALLQGNGTNEVLQLVACLVRELAGAALATVATPDPSGESLVLRVADGDGAEAIVGRAFPGAGSASGEVMRTGRPLFLNDAASADWADQPALGVGGKGPTLVVPLAGDDHPLGTLSVGNGSGGRQFGGDDLELVGTYAGEAAVVLRHGQIRTELERLSVLEERERIARELHDGVVQALFVVGLSLQAAQAEVDDPEETGRRLADAVGSIDRAIRDLRDYIFGLQPGELADRQLEWALHDLAETFQRSGRVSTSVEIDPEAAALLASRSVDVIQAAREAMSNAVRHSGGDHITLCLALAGRDVVLEVLDNGKGLDVDREEQAGHGLANLHSRAEALGGALDIRARPGEGTRVRLRVPA